MVFGAPTYYRRSADPGVGVLRTGALLFGVYISAPQFWNPPIFETVWTCEGLFLARQGSADHLGPHFNSGSCILRVFNNLGPFLGVGIIRIIAYWIQTLGLPSFNLRLRTNVSQTVLGPRGPEDQHANSKA